ncbi:phage tail protein [Streptomyces sp. NPDC048409]|uniref:phage tail protein n=1 Tax=Streptomyces sp. NPDC048409 TaxID=3154723 RepID=UPI00342FFB5E
MRGAVPGLGSPYTLAQQLPAVFQEDAVVEGVTTAWDEVLAPVVSTLDCLDTYLDPWLAPPDYLRWLAERLGVPAGPWPVERRRAMAADAVRLHGRGGCADALRDWLTHMTGGRVEVFETARVYTSAVPDTPFPETGAADQVTIRVTLFDDTGADGAVADGEEIVALAATCLPAHVPFRVEVVSR